MTRIDGNSFGHTPPGPSQGEQAPLQTGNFRGEQLVVKDEASVLADAAEEISLHHSEKAESKKLTEREVEADQHAAVLEIQQIEAYLDAVRAFEEPAKLVHLAKRMRQAAGGENPRDLARRQTRDPTQQYVLLQYAMHGARADGDAAEVLESLQEALDDLEAQHGPQIRAGLNTLGAADEWADTAEDLAQFQQTYQDVVLGDNTLAQTLKLVLERLAGQSGEDFGRGLQGLIKALGADLAAARPSSDRHRLEALVQDLYQLAVVATVLEGCHALGRLLAERHAFSGLQPFELTKDLVAVTSEKWVASTRFTGMADQIGLRDLTARVEFCKGVNAALRDLPTKVFADDDARQSILHAAQDALDEAIDREEE